MSKQTVGATSGTWRPYRAGDVDLGLTLTSTLTAVVVVDVAVDVEPIVDLDRIFSRRGVTHLDTNM